MRAAAASVVGLGAVALSAYYWPALVDEPATSIKNYQIAAAAPKLRSSAWSLIQSAFKEQVAELGPIEFGDPVDVRRRTTVKYGYICREIYEEAPPRMIFKFRLVDDSFAFDFSVLNQKDEDIGVVSSDFKLAGENFRNGSSSFRLYGNPRKSASTTYEAKDPLQPITKQFEFALYSSSQEHHFSTLLNTYGKLVG